MHFSFRATTSWLVVAAIVAGAGRLQAEEVRWLTSPSAAVAAAAEEQRPIVVYITGSYCSHCRRMDRNTWDDRSVQRTIAEGFVPLKLDAERDAEYIEQLGIQGVPTTLIVSPNRRIRATAAGYVEPRKLQDWLNRTASEIAGESK